METVFVPGRGNVRLGKKIKSPLPVSVRGKPDRHASFSLFRSKHNRDVILWKDHGTGQKGSYNELMKLLGHGSETRLFGRQELEMFKPKTTVKVEGFAELKTYKEKLWTPEDEALWHPYGVILPALRKYHTKLIERLVYEKDGIEHELTCKDSQICIWMYDGIMKMYRINERVKPKKHLTLGSGDAVFGLNAVPEGTEDVILVGGQKDCMSLFSNTGFYGIALNSESADLLPIQFMMIKKKAKRIWSWYDDDEAGRTGTQKLKRSFLIKPLNPVPELPDPRWQRDPANWFRAMVAGGLNFKERRELFINHFNQTR